MLYMIIEQWRNQIMNPLDSILGTIISGVVLSIVLVYVAKWLVAGV